MTTLSSDTCGSENITHMSTGASQRLCSVTVPPPVPFPSTPSGSVLTLPKPTSKLVNDMPPEFTSQKGQRTTNVFLPFGPMIPLFPFVALSSLPIPRLFPLPMRFSLLFLLLTTPTFPFAAPHNLPNWLLRNMRRRVSKLWNKWSLDNISNIGRFSKNPHHMNSL